MPYTPKENKRFLNRLIEDGSMPFDEVVKIYADKKGKVKRNALETTLTMLWIEETFSVLDEQGNEVSWREDAVHESPSSFTVRFNGIAEKEANIASGLADRIDAQDIQSIEDRYCWAGIKRREPLRVFGDPDAAPALAERLRAFTHQFAFHFVRGDDEQIAAAFSARAEKGQTLAQLREEIAKVEKEFGPFDYFDHVHVVSAYTSDPAGISTSAQMRLPKGIGRDEQRGEAQFRLISVRTPHGLPVHDYTVALYIIEEEGLFRIAQASAFSGY